MKLFNMCRALVATAVLFLVSCSSLDERHNNALMDKIEKQVQLPEGSLPINEYARYYALDDQGLVVAEYVTWVEPDLETLNLAIGRRRWLNDFHKLPGVMDGGCTVVNVRFNPSTYQTEQAFCNSDA